LKTCFGSKPWSWANFKAHANALVGVVFKPSAQGVRPTPSNLTGSCTRPRPKCQARAHWTMGFSLMLELKHVGRFF